MLANFQLFPDTFLLMQRTTNIEPPFKYLKCSVTRNVNNSQSPTNIWNCASGLSCIVLCIQILAIACIMPIYTT